MKLGMFMMPVHDPTRDFHTVLNEDVETAIHCDRVGFDEFWIGEHYTSRSEPVSDPFIFLANLIARTQRIKLGTAVINLPQRHPALTAAHAALLDHLSEGRLLLGISPGGLPSDFELFEVTDADQRKEMADEAIDAILKLWTSEAPFEINGKYWRMALKEAAHPDLGVDSLPRPYQKPHPPIVYAVMSPNSSSVRKAVAHGWGFFSANFIPTSNVRSHWEVYLDACGKAGRAPDPSEWRVARSIFVGKDDAEAKDYMLDPEGPFAAYYNYLATLIKRYGFQSIMKRDPDMPDDEVTPEYALREFCIAGDPDSVFEQVMAFREDVGDFGTIVMTSTDFLNEKHGARLLDSMTLMARGVMPKLRAAVGARSAA